MSRIRKILFLLLIGMLIPVMAEAKITPQEDQAVDEQLGFLDKTWAPNLPSMYTRQSLPAQLNPGPAPFMQQAQNASNPSVQGLNDGCLKFIPGTVIPPTPGRYVNIC